MLFIPNLAYIDPASLLYPTGLAIKNKLTELNVPIVNSKQVKILGTTTSQKYFQSKKIILVTVNKQNTLRPCRPSADYQFALSSSCPGHCEYCYLQTSQGEKPYIKIFANIEEILTVLQKYIEQNIPNATTFECGSITDPLATEHLTGSLAQCIKFFGHNSHGRLRAITKYDNVDSLLHIEHNGHTKFRISINTDYVIKNFEHNTASLPERVQAIKSLAEADYPIGFIIAPIMIYNNWKIDYNSVLSMLHKSLIGYNKKITFELIQHRYTKTAKNLILQRFPNTKLDMNEDNRRLKWGPYGQFKYVYPNEIAHNIRTYLNQLIINYFPNSEIEYFT